MPERLAEEEYRELGIRASLCSREAFDQLYRHLHQALIGFIRSKISDLEDAQDLSQETWSTCLTRKASYNSQFTFYTFLRHFANYKLLDYFRRHRRTLDLRTLLKAHPELESLVEAGDDISQPWSGESGRLIFSSPDAKAVFKELLELSFECVVKPHQLLVLGFRILEWQPREILAELSNLTLSNLAEKLASEACRCFSIEGPQSTRFFAPITSELKNKVAAVYVESEYRDLRNRYRDALTGDTWLKDYLRTNAAKSLYDWMDDIRAKLEQLFKENGFHTS
jgi:RNA polymerase sigma factor (sigma-70 family)